MTTKSLNKREELALNTLATGGYFRKALERTYQGRDQFVMRLRDANGQVVKGVGYATWSKFNNMRVLKDRPCTCTSTWPTEWALT